MVNDYWKAILCVLLLPFCFLTEGNGFERQFHVELQFHLQIVKVLVRVYLQHFLFRRDETIFLVDFQVLRANSSDNFDFMRGFAVESEDRGFSEGKL